LAKEKSVRAYGYRYDQNENAVVLSVDFAVDAQAKAFVKRFGDQSAILDV
jgi:hypothetical protein